MDDALRRSELSPGCSGVDVGVRDPVGIALASRKRNLSPVSLSFLL
jgi:hypothetical protein